MGFHTAESLGQSTSSDEKKKSPLKPCGKGNKRKQEDLDLEEKHSWETFMTEDLPDEDQDDDPTYEPSKSDTDSEEHHSKNETESDIEIEEKDGVVMIKEHVEKREEDLSNKEETHGDEQTNRGEPNPDSNVQKTDGGDQEAVSSAGTS
ncbi:myelin transcription factor 1-like protein [Spea bombifrons]|uniref:myelin transcription factor 1-like protein n=1 Tax=Spea bombifrons TaxID=233779 RepID=UPI00234A56F2|nr:myelin transcription factor 1-like protein [Spea bombifrons]